MEAIWPEPGQVLLRDKEAPVCSREQLEDGPFAFLRGRIDCSELKAQLLALPRETWEDEFQEGNAKARRPLPRN